MDAVTIHSDFGAQENKICHCFHFFPICHEVMGPYSVILVSWMLSFKPNFSLSSFTLIKRLLAPLCFLPLEWYYLHIRGYWVTETILLSFLLSAKTCLTSRAMGLELKCSCVCPKELIWTRGDGVETISESINTLHWIQ